MSKGLVELEYRDNLECEYATPASSPYKVEMEFLSNWKDFREIAPAKSKRLFRMLAGLAEESWSAHDLLLDVLCGADSSNTMSMTCEEIADQRGCTKQAVHQQMINDIEIIRKYNPTIGGMVESTIRKLRKWSKS